MDDRIRLSGGIFFALLVRAKRKQPRNADRCNGKKGGSADPDVLLGLTQIVNPDFQIYASEYKSAKDSTRRYKDCSATGDFYQLDNQDFISSFGESIRNGYQDLLYKFCDFVSEFLDLSLKLKKEEILVRALLEVIALDEEITDSQEFYVLESGGSITKKELLSTTFNNVCLESFLLGIWHYVICFVEDNRVGQYTYNNYWKSNNGKERVYNGFLGEKSTRNIKVYRYENSQEEEECIDTTIQEETAEPVIEIVEEKKFESNAFPTVNFNISGGNNNIYNNVGTVINGVVKDEH